LSYYTFTRLSIFNIIPINANDINKLLPPYDKNGSGTPTIGKSPVIPAKFIINCRLKKAKIPITINLESLSGTSLIR